MLPDPAAPDLTQATHAAGTAEATDYTFYPEPPSWFGKHVGPWLLFLPLSGLLGYFWQAEHHSFWEHLGFLAAEGFMILVLYMVLTDKRVLGN